MSNRELDSATKAWRIFHQKKNPDKILELRGAAAAWPDEWYCAGRVTRLYYHSDKWYTDGRSYNYYHDHGPEIYCWHPRKRRSVRGLPRGAWVRKAMPIRSAPSALTVLGDCLGWDLEVSDGRLRARADEGELLACTSDRRKLVVVSPLQGVTAVLAGRGLRVERRGVVG